MSLAIGARRIGAGEPVYLIAEVGVTHNGNIAAALALVDAAAQAGADAVKFQILDPDALFSQDGKSLLYSYRDGTGKLVQRNLYALLMSCRLADEAWPVLAARARERGIEMFATVESAHGVEIGERLGFPAYKICSWDLGARDLISQVVRTGKPVLFDVDPRKGDLGTWWIRERMDVSPFVLVYAPHHEPTLPEFLLTSLVHLCVGYSAPDRSDEFDLEALSAGACVLERRLTLTPFFQEGHHHYEASGPEAFKAWVERCRAHDAHYGGGRHPYHRDPRTGRRPYR